MQINHIGVAPDKSKPIEKCVICQSPLDRDVSNISGCSHQFHKDCIDNWKNITNKCPVCRKRFTFIQQGLHKYKVAEKDQKHDDGLTDEYLNTLDEEPCQICQSTDYAEYGLLCDGCDKCYHTHCLGLDAIPDGNWYCDTCKCLQSNKRSTRNNDYNLNHHTISRNENNREWLASQDEDWTPPAEAEDIDESSDNNEEFEDLKQDELHNNNNNNKNRNRKRKRNESESDFSPEIRNNKRRKISNNRRESPMDNLLKRRSRTNNNNNNNKLTAETSTWDCDECTFTNEWDNEICFMCEAKKPRSNVHGNKLSMDDYFSSSNNKNRNKKKDDIKKEKFSRSNPYRKKQTFAPFVGQNTNSINSIIGDDILANFDLDEDDDLLSVTHLSNDNNINDKHEAIEDYEDDDIDIDIEFKPKPKVKYKDKLKKLTEFRFI